MWPFTLSGRLPIVALVGHYPANKLIGRGLIQRRQVPKEPRLSPRRLAPSRTHAVLPSVSRGYPPPLGRLPTRYSPVRCSCTPEGALPLNLHVLGTPPAFILSQDQTLQLKFSIAAPKRSAQFKREFSLFELVVLPPPGPKTVCRISFRRSIRRSNDRGPLVSLDPVFKEPRPVAGLSI